MFIILSYYFLEEQIFFLEIMYRDGPAETTPLVATHSIRSHELLG